MRQRAWVVSGLIVLVFGCQTRGATLRPPAPQAMWKIGDSWKVRTWDTKIRLSSRRAGVEAIGKGLPIDTIFEVRRLVSTSDFETPYLRLAWERERYGNPTLPPEGYKCFEIQAAFPPQDSGYQERFLLYFRQDTGNLIRILKTSGNKDAPPRELYWDFSPVPEGPIVGTDYTTHGRLFDFPDFTQDPNFVRASPIGRDPNYKEVTKQTITTRTVKSEDGAEHEEYEVVMVTGHAAYELRTVQKWRKGDPWWYEARHYENGKPIGYEAVLLPQSKPSK